MARGKSDIANMAIRIFLQKVGNHYDSIRGYTAFKPTDKQGKEVLSFFENKCAYCDELLNKKNTDWDHLIPINKTSLGLHAWGNLIPSCKQCNKNKHHKGWQEFVTDQKYKSKIIEFQKKYKYEPNQFLEIVAKTLYEDVGSVAMTLIELRYKQAQNLLEEFMKK